MKRIVLIAAVLLASTSLSFGQTPGMGLWPFDWANTTSYVDYMNPYDAQGYVYDYSTYQWVGGTETNDGLITITCDIEMYMSMHLDATDVYFHIADDRTAMAAYINGWLASNNGQWLFVSSDLGNKDLDNLEYVVDGFGRDLAYMTGKGYTTTIPVEWLLKEPGDVDWRPGIASIDGNSGNLHGYTWLLSDGEPCTHPFTIKILIKPEFHQPDGRYEMDPLLTCSPAL
ncbi:MAG: hypothetical protein DWQ05_16300 [Calditrichaeota bacterium]|nr:MAG: hypothetical protein DWQ05_16300 [Calditrichota bacterium]